MEEDELIHVSALQHALFCPRQYALIHIEQIWEENRFTAEGRVLHERVDEVHHEKRRDSKIEFGLAVRSLDYGLVGKCDLVEFEKDSNGNYKKVLPVEFKRGRKKADDYDFVQLCAQALCLEEIFSIDISLGQIYYLQEHRRTDVEITEDLREKTRELIELIKAIRTKEKTPDAVYRREKCDRCSLFDFCMPKTVGKKNNIERYLRDNVEKMMAEE